MRIGKNKIENLRQDYRSATLSENDVESNPINQFANWFTAALKARLHEPNAMVLATADAEGKPSARVVLLKAFDENGFTFYTNYQSRKGQELTSNPFAAIVFYWGELERQVRIEGSIEKVSEAESERYFHSRPKGSQLGALVSAQSEEINSRDVLEKNLSELIEKYENAEIPKPSYWGGFILKPERIEFWQGRSSRLHDRILYKKVENNWEIVRLAP